MTGIVILAAGRGSRLKITTPKALQCLGGYPLLDHILAKLPKVPTYIIINPESQPLFPKRDHITYLYQQNPNGTGDALIQNIDTLIEHESLIVLNGDTPFIPRSLIQQLINHSESNILVGFKTEDPKQYGQIIYENSLATAIIEMKDIKKKVSSTCYSGVMKISSQYLQKLTTIAPSKATGEYYLTSIVSNDTPFHTVCHDPRVLVGVNTPEELTHAHQVLKQLQLESLLASNSQCHDADSLLISPYATIGESCTLGPQVSIYGKTQIGSHCTIAQGAIITDSNIETDSHILPYSVITHSTVGKGSSIGPYTHVQNTTAHACHLGNFVEVKRSIIKQGVKAKHLCYLGDSYIDEKANIGAGVITCNYIPWRAKKSLTYVGESAFVGAGSLLIGPCIVGAESVIAAGSVLTQFVQPYALAISRPPLTIKPSWRVKRLKLTSG